MTDDTAPGQGPSPLAAGELQDHLLTALTDLDRLRGLIDDAARALMGHFASAVHHVSEVSAASAALALPQREALDGAMADLRGAVTALQFHDMATQLMAHTGQTLRGCADRLALQAMGSEDGDDAMLTPLPDRPSPVVQDEMDAGSVELF